MTIINRSVLLTALFVMNAAAVLLWPSAALAKERTDIVRMNFTWDENYLYAAVEVNDPDIQGSTKAPNQPVGDDDAVAIYLQTDRKKDAAIGPNSFRMLVSAAGGCEFSHGEDGKWVKKDIFTFKYAVKVDGSVSQDQDDDSGYTVEIAIPWTELGLAGNVGTSMLFNATVQMKGEHTGFLSLVKGVQTDADRDNPSKWDELWLRGPVQPLVIRNPGRIMINRSLQHRPVVDGRMLASEYNEKSAFEIQKPPIKQAVHILRDFPVENLIFASYYYDYDTTEPQSSFVNKPFGGFGPWFTGSRIEFHRGMLRDARRAGIDVLLAVNSVTPLPANRTATLALVGALKEMTIAKEAYPLVALMLASPADAIGGQQAIWAAITRFYSQIPPEYRTTVRLPESRGGQTALPVFIKGAFSLTKEARAWLDEQAQAEYGEKLLVVSDESAGGEADGFLPNFAPGTGRGYSDKGWVKIGKITPGYVRDGQVLGRYAGATYLANWDTIIENNPDWLLIDSFNNWHDGSEIAASGEYGLLYVDQTAIQSSRFNGRREWSAKYLSSSVAPVASVDTLSIARVEVRNVGTRAWQVSDQIRFGYRWYQGGRLYSQGLVTVPLQANVGINEMVRLNVGVAAVDKDKDPLPEGNWTLVFDMIAPDGRLFSAQGDRPLAVPVKVGTAPAKAYTILSSSIPVGMMPGEAYLASVVVRNDGSEAWTKGGSVVMRLQASQGDQADKAQALATWTAALPENVRAGSIVEIPIVLDLRKAPAVTSPESPLWVKVDMEEGTSAIAASSGRASVFASALGQSNLGAGLKAPDSLIPEQTYGTPTRFQIQVSNNGAREWPSDTRLVASWYSLDGRLLVKNGGEGRVKKRLKPGERVPVPVELRSPSYPGQYVVRWQPALNQTDGTNDLFGGPTAGVITQYVTVTAPSVEAQDLSTLFDSDVLVSETLAEGSFDGQTGLPAEMIPPFVIPNNSPSHLYPVGVYSADPEGGIVAGDRSSWRWISFRWPSKADDSKNAISANGQTLTVNTASVVRVHVLAAASGGAKSAEFVLNYGSGQQKIQAAVGDWNAPGAGDIVAFQAAYRASATEIQAKTAYLYDVVVKADPSQSLSSIILPKDASIKILAVSLEKIPPTPVVKG